MWNLKPQCLPNNCFALISLAPKCWDKGCLPQVAGWRAVGMLGGGQCCCLCSICYENCVLDIPQWPELQLLSMSSSSSTSPSVLLSPAFPYFSVFLHCSCSHSSLSGLICHLTLPSVALLSFFQDLWLHWYCGFSLSALSQQHGCFCNSSWVHVESVGKKKKNTSISVVRAQLQGTSGVL